MLGYKKNIRFPDPDPRFTGALSIVPKFRSQNLFQFVVLCWRQILDNEKQLRRREFERMFGMDFEGYDLVD